ncbi:MAG TPA: chemotaxis protein CheD [Phenylobacterium sp.]
MTDTATSLRPQRRLNVVQGEYLVSNDPDVFLTTVLGSCVAVCLRDPDRGVGGMNHFLLPDGYGEQGDHVRRYGVHAMELLINALLHQGAQRNRLEAKLFGGARMFDGLSDVGAANAAFAERFLKDEGIAVSGSSLGGVGARRLKYWPVSGRAQQKVVNDRNELVRLNIKTVPPVLVDGDLELF